MGNKKSTSEDPDIVRAAGEGMVKRHSPEGDKRAEREEAEKRKQAQTKKK